MAKDRRPPRPDAIGRTVKEETRTWLVVAGLLIAWAAARHIIGG